MQKKLLFFLTTLAIIIGLAGIVYSDNETTTLSWVIPANVDHSLAYGGSCSQSAMYFREDNSDDSDTDGNGWQIPPWDAESGGATCQDASTAPITITNAGNVTIDINASITTTLETGVTLKAWLGTDSGCGVNGLSGWQFACDANGIDDTGVPDQNNCVELNNSDRFVIANLEVSDTNQLCLAADFNSMSQGTTTDTLQTTGTQ